MKNSKQSANRTETNSSVIIFFILAYGITWGLSALVSTTLLPFTLPSILVTVASLFTGYGPAFAAISMLFFKGGRNEVIQLLAKYGRWKVDAKWYFFVFLFPLLVSSLAVGIDVLLGGTLPNFFSADAVPSGNPLILLPIIYLIVFLQTGFAEETGWRGYALPALQQRFGALTSSIILGIVWAAWHFGPMSMQSSLGFWYFFDVIPLTILLTTIYNNTKGSLLLVALFHASVNVSTWIIPTVPNVSNANSLRTYVISGIVMWVAAIICIIVFGAKDLSRTGKVQD